MSHERLALPVADLEDLDAPALDAFVARRAPAVLGALSRDDAGVRLGLLARSPPRVVPTTAGLYVFGRLPQLFFPEWGLVCVASSGVSLLDPVVARADLEGAMAALLEGALAFVRARSNVEGGSEGHEYPEAVVREVIVNALVHRDLRRPSRVAVRLFVDRLEVWSPGGAPEGLSDLEEIGREGGVSQPRNPIVASIARTLGLGEQLGRGLPMLLRSDPSAVGPRVELRATPREVLVVLPSRWQPARVGAGYT